MKRFLIFTLISICVLSLQGTNRGYKMLVGTYTSGTKSEGIYALNFDKNGKLTSKILSANTENPSFLALSPDKKFVYAVNETGLNSFVSAFSFDKNSEKLNFLNKRKTGADPCFVSVTNNHVFTANYSGGSVSIFTRNNNGFLADSVETIKHPRKIFGKGRFGPSNAHQILFSPDSKYAIATNLGNNAVFSYLYQPDSNAKLLAQTDVVYLSAHSGPRHAVFSKSGKLLYVLQELIAGISALEFQQGKLNVIQQTTLINDSSLRNGAADIHISPDEKFLYATNRGDNNNITCFKILKSGLLEKKFAISTGGIAPRNFNISPDGKFIFIGNQKSNKITVFSRSIKSGKLKKLSQEVEVGAPVCLLFY